MYVCMYAMAAQQGHRACQGKCLDRNTSVLVAALAVKSGNNKIIYEGILIALTDATNDLSVPCHGQLTGSATVRTYVHTYVHTYVRTYVRTYGRTYVCMYVCMYVCICSLCMYIGMHV